VRWNSSGRGRPPRRPAFARRNRGGPRAARGSRDPPEPLPPPAAPDEAGRKDLNAFNSLLRDRRTDIYG